MPERPKPNHFDETVLTPALLFALNVTAIMAFYLAYVVIRVPPWIGYAGRAQTYLALTCGLLVTSSLALRLRRRWLLITNLVLHLGLYVTFFRLLA
ncbi:MAG: hypothetical protein AAGE01_05475 [Pseudomonadota bacterium]